MSRVEAIFDLVDKMSSNLEAIRSSAERTEGAVEGVTESVNTLEARLAAFSQRRVDAQVGLDTREFRRELLTSIAQLRAFGAMEAKPALGGQGGGLGIGVKAGPIGVGGAGSAGGLLIGGLIGTLPIASVAVQGLTAGVGALVPMLGAAGAGFGVLAGVAIPAIKGITDGWEEVKTAQEAVRTARTPEEYAAATDQLRIANAKLSPIQKSIVEDVKALGAAWKDVAAGPTAGFLASTHSLLGELEPSLRRLQPIIHDFADVWLDGLDAVTDFFGDSERMEFLERILEPLPPLLRLMGRAIGSLVELFGMLSIAASPLASWMLTSIVDALQGLVDAGNDGGIERLTGWFDSMRPILGALWYLFTAIIEEIWNLGNGATDVFPELIRAIADELVPALGDLSKGLSLLIIPAIILMSEGLGVLNDLFGDWTPLVYAAAGALVLFNFLMGANPAVAITLAIVLLIGWLKVLDDEFGWVGIAVDIVRVKVDQLIGSMESLYKYSGLKFFVEGIQNLAGGNDFEGGKSVSAEDLHKATGGKKPGFPIPGGAEGAIITKPTIMMAGEKNMEEWLIPMRKPQGREMLTRAAARMGMGGGGEGGRGFRQTTGPLVAINGDITIASEIGLKRFMDELSAEIRVAAAQVAQ